MSDTTTAPEVNSVLPNPTSPESNDLFAAAMKAAVEANPPPPEEVAPAPAEALPEPVKAATPAPAPEPPKPAEKVAPTLLRLMEREAALVEREASLKKLEQELASVKEQASSVEQARNKFLYDPVSFIRQMAPDVDLADLAKSLWYENLGENAPSEYRVQREARAAKSGIDELRAEMEQKLQQERQRWTEEAQQREAETAYNQYVGALGEFAKSVSDEYPLVKSFAANSPDQVQRGLLKIAQEHAHATGGEVLPPAECAARLNKELEALRSALGVTSAPAASPAQPKEAPPVATLRNKHTSVQPNRGLPDPKDEEAKFYAALEAAQMASASKQ